MLLPRLNQHIPITAAAVLIGTAVDAVFFPRSHAAMHLQLIRAPAEQSRKSVRMKGRWSSELLRRRGVVEGLDTERLYTPSTSPSAPSRRREGTAEVLANESRGSAAMVWAEQGHRVTRHGDDWRPEDVVC
jgi:hypothetical protein